MNKIIQFIQWPEYWHLMSDKEKLQWAVIRFCIGAVLGAPLHYMFFHPGPCCWWIF